MNIELANTDRVTRQTGIFYAPTYTTNIEFNIPLVRMQRNHDSLFNSIDMTRHTQLNAFKKQVTRTHVLYSLNFSSLFSFFLNMNLTSFLSNCSNAFFRCNYLKICINFSNIKLLLASRTGRAQTSSPECR